MSGLTLVSLLFYYNLDPSLKSLSYLGCCHRFLAGLLASTLDAFCGLNCVPQKRYIKVLTSVSVNVTLFGYKVFANII